MVATKPSERCVEIIGFDINSKYAKGFFFTVMKLEKGNTFELIISTV